MHSLLILGIGMITSAVGMALLLLYRRQHRLAQQVKSLSEDVALVRIEGLLEDPEGDDGQPRITRRKKHLGLLGVLAAGLGIGAAWAREHRAASIAAAGAVAAATVVALYNGWDDSADHPAAPVPSPSTSAPEPSLSEPEPEPTPSPSRPTPSSTRTVSESAPSTPGPATSLPAPRAAESSVPAPTPTGVVTTATTSPSATIPGGGRGTGEAAPPGLVRDRDEDDQDEGEGRGDGEEDEGEGRGDGEEDVQGGSRPLVCAGVTVDPLLEAGACLGSSG